jgi:hypothetical protein
MTSGKEVWHDSDMPKKLKNPTDPNLLARSVIEAAIGEPLLPGKPSKKAPKSRPSRHKKR